MLDAVRAMLGSKKAIAGIAGVVVAAALRVGLELETDAVAAVLAPILAYILGQGAADIGKNSTRALLMAATVASCATTFTQVV